MSTIYEETLAEFPLPDPVAPIPWVPFAEWPLSSEPAE